MQLEHQCGCLEEPRLETNMLLHLFALYLKTDLLLFAEYLIISSKVCVHPIPKCL